MLGQFIGLQGRVKRGTWWTGYVFSVFLFAIAWMLTGVNVVDQAGLQPGFDLGTEKGLEDIFKNAFDTGITPGAGTAYHFNVISLLCYVLAFIINMSVTVKRYHDLNKSGIWWLIGFIPVLNFWQWAECGSNLGDDGPNRFGPPPGYGSLQTSEHGSANTMMAKLDDDYMAEYARKIAQQQVDVPGPVSSPQQSTSSASAGPVFGKR